jgi:hypothetical protein
MRRLFLLAALAFVLPAHSQPAATLPDLVAPDDSAAPALPAAARAEGKSRARIDRRVMGEMAPGSKFGFTPPGAVQRQFVVERTVDHANGDRTVVGRLIDGEGERRAIVTTGAAGTVGRLDTPEGRFLIHGSGDALELTDRKASGRRVAPPTRDDDRRPPQSARLQAESAAAAAGSAQQANPQAANAIPAGNSVIDLLVLTSPKMSTRYPGALLQTRINNLIEIANQAYINSRIAITLRVVRQQQVAYGDGQSLNLALDDLTNSSGGLAGAAALRTQYGADLVTLLRPYDSAVDSGCGIAWVIDHAGSPASYNRTLGMSVVSDGDDLQPRSLYYCPDTALAHEIGHNLGSAHDRAHSSAAGTYSYSYGYGFDNIFGTIMSYIDPGVELFSNPRINTCAGRPCGVAIGSPGEADNATSMNNTRTAAAAFTPAAVPVSSGLNDLLIDFGTQYGIWARRNDSVWEQVHGMSARQMAAGDLDKDGRADVVIDFGSPYGIWLWRNGSSWAPLHDGAAQQIVATDLDNNGVSDFVINFGSLHGLWVWRNNTATWAQLHGLAPRQVVSASLDSDPRRDLIVDFGAPYGIYLYMNDSKWVHLHGTTAKDIVAGDLDGNGIDEIIIDFGPLYGLWIRMNQTSWVQLHGASSQHMAVGNLDADPRKDLVVDFGGQGIWMWKNATNWVLLHEATSKALAMADLDRNGVDDLIVDFGPLYGLWTWKNGSKWAQLHGSSPRQFIAVDVDGQ